MCIRDRFTTVFPGLSDRAAMTIFALIILVYTFLGGFKAVCWTDFFQGFLMLFALLAVPIVAVVTLDMDTSALGTVYTYTDTVSGKVVECAFGTGVFDASINDILSGLAWGLGYFGMPHILVRFMSIEKPSMIKKSATVAIIWVILSLAATCLIAYFGRMVLAEELLTTGSQKMVFIEMCIRDRLTTAWVYALIVLINAEKTINVKQVCIISAVYLVLSQILSIFEGRYDTYALHMRCV